jgi:hypothetical protein
VAPAERTYGAVVSDGGCVALPSSDAFRRLWEASGSCDRCPPTRGVASVVQLADDRHGLAQLAQQQQEQKLVEEHHWRYRYWQKGQGGAAGTGPDIRSVEILIGSQQWGAPQAAGWRDDHKVASHSDSTPDLVGHQDQLAEVAVVEGHSQHEGHNWGSRYG